MAVNASAAAASAILRQRLPMTGRPYIGVGHFDWRGPRIKFA